MTEPRAAQTPEDAGPAPRAAAPAAKSPASNGSTDAPRPAARCNEAIDPCVGANPFWNFG
jgi:hypothetical protein